MMGYYGATHITDGQQGFWIESAGDIHVKGKDGSKTVIFMDGRYIRGHKLIRDGRVLVEERLGESFRGYAAAPGYNIKGPIYLPYKKHTRRALHGIAWRLDQSLFKAKGRCRTEYGHGRFIWQEFRYANRRMAYKIHHNSKEVTIKYSSGKIAAVIQCPGGFSARSGHNGFASKASHTCALGKIYFPIDQEERERRSKRYYDEDDDSARRFDFSKAGDCTFTFYDHAGRVHHKGAYVHSQRVGDWTLNGRAVHFLNGIPISKKLWETPREKLNVKKTLKIKNVQLRAALLGRIGGERIAKESKYKVIDRTKNGMLLMEFPIAVDDGNGGKDSKMRILKVVCPTTKNDYYLNVPDFVWNGGQKTKLNKCEQARQWTFGVDDPRQTIKFAKET